MTPIEKWMADNGITSARSVGAPKNAESPYKVLAKRKVPWAKEEQKVPVNDPNSQGYTFTLSKPATEPKPDPGKMMPDKKLPMPKRTQVRIQFFTPPGSNKAPGVEDVIGELQEQFDLAKDRQAAGDNSPMPQPYLGTMMVLHTWLSDSVFTELMNVR